MLVAWTIATISVAAAATAAVALLALRAATPAEAVQKSVLLSIPLVQLSGFVSSPANSSVSSSRVDW